MGNINPEINDFKSAAYGEDVRDSIIALARKLNAIVEQVVVDTDRDVIIGYKTIDPEEYNHTLANIDIAAVFAAGAAPNNWVDAPTSNPFTIITTRRSVNFNLQVAIGLAGKPNLYWRTVDRRTHEPESPGWITDDTPIDTTLSVSGAAAEAGAVGYALSEKVDNSDGTISNGLAIGTTVQGTQNNNKALSVGEVNRAANNSVAVGYYCEAANNAMAVGNGLEASTNQLVIGEENAPDTNHDYYFIVGKGNYENAHTIDKDGNAWFAGNVKIGGTSAANGSELATKMYVDTAMSEITGSVTFDSHVPQNSKVYVRQVGKTVFISGHIIMSGSDTFNDIGAALFTISGVGLPKDGYAPIFITTRGSSGTSSYNWNVGILGVSTVGSNAQAFFFANKDDHICSINGFYFTD